MSQNQSSIKVEVVLDPNIKLIIDEVSSNLKKMNSLLEDNKKLLTKTVQAALKIVKTPLNAEQSVIGKSKGKAA